MERNRTFRIALLGDFSGRSTRLSAMRAKLAGVAPVSVDPGNFEDVMESMGVEVRLGENGDAPALRFRSIEDFHPDEIYTRAHIFHAIRAARTELKRPLAPQARPNPVIAGNLLEAMAAATVAPPSRNLWDQAIESIVGPHSLPKPDPRQEQVRASLDSVASEVMRTILSHPDFQSIEAAWRSVFLLLRHLDCGENLSLDLIDVSREELLADVLSEDDVRSTGLWRILVEEGHHWSLLGGLFTFGGALKDFAALRQVATAAHAANAPFLVEAHPALAASSLDAERAHLWDELRSLPEARNLGLAFPRFLLRLPYGPHTNSVESFDFREMPDEAAPDHDRYLWGNAAVACVCLLGESFQEHRYRNQLESVPVHCFRPNEATPPAEIWMTERAAETLLHRGLMPLVSMRNRDKVLLPSIQSIAGSDLR